MIAVVVLLPWVGCGQSEKQGGDAAADAGQSPAGTGGDGATGGTMPEGATAGDADAGDSGPGEGGQSEGGQGAVGANGGIGALGGIAGSGGSAVAGAGMGGRNVSIPAGWTCLSAVYQDGASCECGCGVRDPDCDDETRDSCDVCRALGSCSSAECPGSIVADDNSTCALPPEWTCSTFHYGDGICDCGCTALDVDCPDASPASCDNCPASGCTPLDCDGTLLPDDNAICLRPPAVWRCPEALYYDGVCDCGCNSRDADCTSNGAEVCERCDSEGSCSNPSCPGVISATRNWFCRPPEPPPTWTCGSGAYGDNFTCHCGCGAQDVDCSNSRSVTDCDDCVGCGDHYCMFDAVDPTDITQCLPPPEDWICNESNYGDLFCDCGCGAPDIDCAGNTTRDACYYCPTLGCAMGDCEVIDPVDNTKCR
jgi:hypothetical protein